MAGVIRIARENYSYDAKFRLQFFWQASIAGPMVHPLPPLTASEGEAAPGNTPARGPPERVFGLTSAPRGHGPPPGLRLGGRVPERRQRRTGSP